jgi:hypothetical protein
MVDSGKTRASGQTGGEAEGREKSKELFKPVENTPEEPLNLTRAFRRMRTDWNSADLAIIRSVKDTVDRQIFDAFSDAYMIEFKIFDTVRRKKISTSTGEILMAEDGLPEYQRGADGGYIEDWSNISSAVREQLLYEISTRMFNWKLRAADAWGEALFAKAVWEEAFATGFDTNPDTKATVDARNARAQRVAADYRFLAVFKSTYSKKADAIISSMELLAQRLKDLHL